MMNPVQPINYTTNPNEAASNTVTNMQGPYTVQGVI
jgi:hypothetical protein